MYNIDYYIKKHMRPLRVFFYDLETERGLEGSVIYAYVIETDLNYNIKEEYEFYSIEELIAFIEKNKGIYIAHNSGGFDFLKMLYKFKEYIDEKLTIVKNGKILRAVLKGKYKGRIFSDSLAVIPMGLKKFKKAFNLEEGKLSYDNINYIIAYQLDKEDWDNLKKYCRQDVITLIKGYKKFENILMKKFGMKKKLFLYPTLSSISFSILRKKAKMKIPKVEMVRQIYAGGRTEIFKFYGENLKYIDINSSYPYVMSHFEYPISKYKKTTDIDLEGFGYGVVMEDTEMYIPFPFIKAKQGSNRKLLFVNLKRGDIILTTNLELRYMIDELDINIEYINGYGAEEVGKPFEYLKDFYEERKKTKDKAMKTTIKLLMNSAYGKFGQKQEVSIFTPNSIGKKRQNLFSNVILASYITARARIHLYEAMRKCGFNNIYYTDTDSLITKRVDEDLLGESLGKWKLEHNIKKYFAIQPKVYFLETNEGIEVKAKGFGRLKAETFEDFERMLKEGVFKRTMVGVSKIIKNNLGETFYGTIIEKKLTTMYDKRKIVNAIDTEAYTTTELRKKGYHLLNTISNTRKAKNYITNLEKIVKITKKAEKITSEINERLMKKIPLL